MQLLATMIRVTALRGALAIKDTATKLKIRFIRTFGRRERDGIRRKLAISSVFMVLPCIIAAHVAFSAFARISQQEAKAQIEAEAIDLQHLIAREFAHMQNLGLYLARIEPLLRNDPDRMKSVFAATLSTNAKQDLHLILADASGQQLFNTRAPTGAILPPLADREGVELVVSERRAVFRHVFRGNVSSRSLYTVLVPVLRDGVVERIVGLNRTTDQLLALIDQQLPGTSWRAAVFDDIGRTILTTNPDAIRVPALTDLVPGVPLTVAAENNTTSVSYLRGKGADWTVAVTANAGDAAKSQWSLFLTLQIGAVLLSLGVAWWTARSIIRPIVHLEELAKNLGAATKQALPTLRIKEVQHAAETLIRTGTVLQQSRERLAAIIASASDAIICIDRHNCITLFNNEAMAIFKCTQNKAIGRSIDAFLSVPIGSFGMELHAARITECTGRRSQGEEFVAEVSMAGPVDDDHYRYSLIVRDITMRQRVAAEHARLAVVVDSSADAIVCLGLDNAVLTWNASAELLFGYSASEILGSSYLAIVPDEGMEDYDRNCERIKSGEAISSTVYRRHKYGALVPVEIKSAPLRDGSGAIVGISSVLRDVSDKINASIIANKLAAIVDASAEAIVGLDSNGTVVTWNPAAGNLFGYSSDEIVGRSLSILLPDEETDVLQDKLRRLLVGGPARVEVARKRSDGTRVSVAVTAAPICDSNANITGFSVVYRDITESKRHEQQMRMVMRELSHRAKNLLAVIAAMARSTANSSADITTFVDDFSSRIHGLARSHDLLVKKEWVDASMRSLVEAQLQPFVFKSDNQLLIHGDDLALSPAAAQMIGLALHELATNAAKHGSFSTATGAVSVAWAIEADDAGSAYLVVTWQESGGPRVAASGTLGFGREVLEEMLAESLDGSTSLTFAESGVVWRLRARLSAVQATGIAEGAEYGMAVLPAHPNMKPVLLAA